MIKYVLAVVSLFMVCSTADAALTYTLELDSSTYDLLQGESVTSTIFLVERATAPGELKLDAARVVGFDIVTDGTLAASLSAAAGNFLINNSSVILNGFRINNATFSEVAATEISPTERRIGVGSATIFGENAGTTMISFADQNESANITFSLDGGEGFLERDALVFPNTFNATVTVSAVPEPSSVAMISMAIGTFCVRSVRRRRAAKAPSKLV